MYYQFYANIRRGNMKDKIIKVILLVTLPIWWLFIRFFAKSYTDDE